MRVHGGSARSSSGASASFGSTPGSARRRRLGRRGDDEGARLGGLEEEREEGRGGPVGEVEVVDEDDERPLPRLGAARRLERGEDLVEEGEAARLLGEARDGGRLGPGGGEARDAGEGRARGGAGRAAAAREGREDVEDGAVRRPVLGDGPPLDDERPFGLRERAPLGEEARLARPLGAEDDDRLPRALRRRAGAPARSGRGARRARRTGA